MFFVLFLRELSGEQEVVDFFLHFQLFIKIISQVTLRLVQMSEQQTWPFIASIIYTAAWSISFYGQVYENFIYKSVEGYSMDYLMMDVVGYVFYAIYSTLGYFFSFKGAGTVVIADLVFAYHALFITLVLSVQACIYPRGKNRVSIYAVVFCGALWVAVILHIIFSQFWHFLPQNEYFNPVSSMGYSKSLISFLKYIPPVYWNWKRKSTKGWSIFNIIMDLVGGIFSMASGGLSVSNGLNVSKMILAVLTVFYDIIFMMQHYCIYNKKRIKNENEPLSSQEKV